jgi:choline dehydrogenase
VNNKPRLTGITRRRFLQFCTACASGMSAVLSGCASLLRPPHQDRPFEPITCAARDGSPLYDYVVIGSGAGGGPLAANLARAGFSVLLLEAGGDDESYDYQVPAFHTRASEDENMRWDFFVRHYHDDAQQQRDEKFTPARNGVLYPRAGTLGGCTAHHAMITLYPHNSDWDYIADITGDDSWRSDNMRRYFERLERCEYAEENDTAARHGFKGWLTTNIADPLLVVRDKVLWKLVKSALKESFRTLGRPITRVLKRLDRHLDPNDWRMVRENSEGVCYVPVSIAKGRRQGVREYIRRVLTGCPGNLSVMTHALATRLIIADGNRVTGVEYVAGPHLYRADPRASAANPATRHTLTVKREVIVCGGAFNTPQLLKLSGIGPSEELRKLGIDVRVPLPGVGENLQDRYEVAVVSKLKEDLSLIKDMKFRPPEPGEEPDPQFQEWINQEGPYTTNGAAVAMVKRSASGLVDPDLFMFGLIGFFKGYFPGYSKLIAQGNHYFTWAILKAHTKNRTGRVTLRSADPFDVPQIDFNYFNPHDDPQQDDLAAVVEGVHVVRRIMERAGDVVESELLPGSGVKSDEQIKQFVRDNAWGHHACGTCKIGPHTDPTTVLDSRFRVHGTTGLRVVDASVFPRIPGFFIVSAIYMVSEKATDVIIEDAVTDR